MKPSLTGTVISAGRMMRAVKVRSSKQTWNAKIQKHFTHPTTHLVADPTTALRAGDVIRMAPEPHSRHIHHVVAAIIAPWGVPIDARPAVLTRAEREARKGAKRERKVARKEEEKGRWREGEGKIAEAEGVREEEREGEGDRTRRAGEEVGGRMQGRLDGAGERRPEQAGM